MSENKKVLVDISAIRRPHKPYSDSTLNSAKKSELIEYVRMMEKNVDAATAVLNQQYENVKNMHLAKWIPVEERLPDEKGQYLVAYHPCYWENVHYDERCVGVDSFRGNGLSSIKTPNKAWAKNKYQRVTHWMPLPEAPHED